MRKRIYLAVVLSLMLIMGITFKADAALTLWYNGDYNGVNATINYIYPGYFSRVYDDFNVPAGGWTIDTVWSNNILESTTSITQANWEIRSGMSAGNGGTLVDSGISAATITATGRTGFDLNEYTVQVTGLSITLSPGTYWLSVAPVIPAGQESAASNTSGTNAVGSPSGNNTNAFLFSDGLNINFASEPYDYSMGVGGAPVPIPPAIWLLGSGLIGLIGLRRRFKK